LFVNIEGGLATLRQFGRNPDQVRVTEFGQIREIRDHIEDNIDDWDTIVIDNLSELQRLSMQAVMRLVVANNDKRDPDVPGLGEYGKNGEVIRKVIKSFRDMPKHVIFTCHMMDTTDQGTGLPIARPMLQGKLAAEVPGYVDIVGRTSIIKVNEDGAIKKHQVLELAHGGNYVAKTRLALPDRIVDPDFSEMIKVATSAKFGEMPKDVESEVKTVKPTKAA
jgi:hypothetical protein